nr:hypothetical protein [Kibdelosporangium sp. MJ126-NF4]CEL22485.1 hypothetical protein [Kibdelosporangium sp. MJ126-NF4]CTQ89341.1 hypothetical protein [Kibdelosporangium sp. MJ126-NF4]
MNLDWKIFLYYGLGGLALLVVLWPTVKGGQRFLARWGVKDPTEQQGLVARRYLLHRRLLYPPLFLVAPLITAEDTELLPTLIIALSLGEIIAMIRPIRGPRTATLVRRTWNDLVPRWALITMLALAVFAAILATARRFAQSWGNGVVDKYPHDGVWQTDGNIQTNVTHVGSTLNNFAWLEVLVGVTLGTAAVLGIVWLAVYRGSRTDPQVDAALRTRTARVAVGIGIAWMALNVGKANNKLTDLRDIHWPEPAPFWLTGTGGLEALTLPLLFIAMAGWIWVANPDSKMPYIQRKHTTA